MGISLFVAVSDNNVIGKEGKIPWFVRGEQAIFKKFTMGYPIIMGRKTHESIGRTLPGRLNIVISRNSKYQPMKGSIAVQSLKQALSLQKVIASNEVFIIGGEEIYRQAMPLAAKLYLTRVRTIIEGGDKFFDFMPEQWQMISSEIYKKDELNDRPFDFEFQIWRRR